MRQARAKSLNAGSTANQSATNTSWSMAASSPAWVHIRIARAMLLKAPRKQRNSKRHSDSSAVRCWLVKPTSDGHPSRVHQTAIFTLSVSESKFVTSTTLLSDCFYFYEISKSESLHIYFPRERSKFVTLRNR